MTQGHIEQKNRHFEITATDSNVLTTTFESEVIDLFGIGANEEKKGGVEEMRPFIHQVQFHRPQGETI